MPRFQCLRGMLIVAFDSENQPENSSQHRWALDNNYFHTQPPLTEIQALNESNAYPY